VCDVCTVCDVYVACIWLKTTPNTEVHGHSVYKSRFSSVLRNVHDCVAIFNFEAKTDMHLKGPEFIVF